MYYRLILTGKKHWISVGATSETELPICSRSIYSGFSLLSLQTQLLVQIQLACLSLLPWEFPLIHILTSDINAGHQTQIPTDPALSSLSAEKSAGLFLQLRSPAVPPACQVTQRLPPSHQLRVIQAKAIPHTGFQCYSFELEQFTLDLRTWTHLSNSYKH